ncbi:MAG TPA: DUF1800 domain-containing protein [Rhodobacteraceae bacterium]|nr:DUF1800 domain-containing protein [Paracoccaceae bacterium]
MLTRSEIIQAARFEYGVRPDETRFRGGLLDQLAGTDPLDAVVPVESTDARFAELRKLRELRQSMGGDGDAFKQAQRRLRRHASADAMRNLARMVQNPRGFRERLFAFWLDHFTVSPTRVNEDYMLGAYLEEAIRPHISGQFAELLKAAVTHPSMLYYLDQNASTGPNSVTGQRRDLGLNENLAREVLELHTLGVGGPYSQEDVRQFAELLTGLGISPDGVRFTPNRAEPGAEEILGQRYGGARARIEHIYEFLDDLAMNPATATHLAQKLVVHFIGPAPRPALVENMAAAYLASGGNLTSLYEVLLDNPAAKAADFPKVRPPVEYVATVLRALDFDPEAIMNANKNDTRKLGKALEAMGQLPFKPGGPDGWPEAAESWITPPQLAARISWAGQMARAYASEQDPRALMQAVLGDTAPEFLSFAVSGAETKWEGVALLLVSPSLMRR